MLLHNAALMAMIAAVVGLSQLMRRVKFLASSKFINALYILDGF